MAFKSSLTSTVIDKFGSLVHKSFNKLTGTIPGSEVKITANDGATLDEFGYSVSVGSGRIVVGARYDDDNGSNSGSAYLYDLDGTLITKITSFDGVASDFFGKSVSVGSGRIVISATGDDDNGSSSGSAYIYNLDGTQIAKITASDGAINNYFGWSVAVGSGKIVVGAPGNNNYHGSAYIYDLDGNFITKITAFDGAAYDEFGNSVAIGSGRIVVGSSFDDDNGSSSGSAYIFDLDGNLITKITASDGAANDNFGNSVAVGSNRIVVGATGDNAFPLSNSGSAYVYDLNGTLITKITASDAASNDYFGQSVAVGSGRIVVSAYGDDNYKGSAYIYDLSGTLITKITASDGASGNYFGNSVSISNTKIIVGSQRSNILTGATYIYQIEENFDSYIETIVK